MDDLGVPPIFRKPQMCSLPTFAAFESPGMVLPQSWRISMFFLLQLVSTSHLYGSLCLYLSMKHWDWTHRWELHQLNTWEICSTKKTSDRQNCRSHVCHWETWNRKLKKHRNENGELKWVEIAWTQLSNRLGDPCKNTKRRSNVVRTPRWRSKDGSTGKICVTNVSVKNHWAKAWVFAPSCLVQFWSVLEWIKHISSAFCWLKFCSERMPKCNEIW